AVPSSSARLRRESGPWRRVFYATMWTAGRPVLTGHRAPVIRGDVSREGIGADGVSIRDKNEQIASPDRGHGVQRRGEPRARIAERGADRVAGPVSEKERCPVRSRRPVWEA